MFVCACVCLYVYIQAEKSIADDEEEKVGMIAEEVSKKQKGWIAVFIQYLYRTLYGWYSMWKKYSRVHSVCFSLETDCEEDLVKAEPALLAAQEALNTLNKNNLTELKSFGS